MNTRLCVLLLISVSSLSAKAGWNGNGDIDDLFTKLDSVQTRLGAQGNISVTAAELRQQLTLLRSQGVEITSSAEEILAWLQARQGPFRQFIGSVGDRCGTGSPCALFRSDLQILVTDLSALSDRLPAVQKLGIGDGQAMRLIIDRLPPFVLFAVYEAMERMPDWRTIPQVLADIYDEIGDPDAFSVGYEPRATMSLPGSADPTPTQTFCADKADRLDRQIDPVRLNRLQFFIAYLKKALEVSAEFAPGEAGASFIGEGAYGIPLPFKGWLSMIKNTIELVQAGVETYRDNIAICNDRIRELELLVAQCIWIDDFVRPSTGAEVYNVVRNQIDTAAADGVPVVKANSFLNRASPTGMTKDEYQTLCSAYSKIGS